MKAGFLTFSCVFFNQPAVGLSSDNTTVRSFSGSSGGQKVFGPIVLRERISSDSHFTGAVIFGRPRVVGEAGASTSGAVWSLRCPPCHWHEHLHGQRTFFGAGCARAGVGEFSVKNHALFGGRGGGASADQRSNGSLAFFGASDGRTEARSFHLRDCPLFGVSGQ